MQSSLPHGRGAGLPCCSLLALAWGWVLSVPSYHDRPTFSLCFSGPQRVTNCLGSHASLNHMANPQGCSWGPLGPTDEDSAVTHCTQVLLGP